MKEKSTGTGAESRPTWESLEALARQGVQRLLQQLLEEEVEQVVGRRRYARRGRGRRRAGISERARQATPAEHDDRHDHDPPAPSPRAGGTIREPAAAAVQAAHGRSRPAAAGAVPARAGPGRLRPGPAGAAGGGGAAVGPGGRSNGIIGFSENDRPGLEGLLHEACQRAHRGIGDLPGAGFARRRAIGTARRAMDLVDVQPRAAGAR